MEIKICDICKNKDENIKTEIFPYVDCCDNSMTKKYDLCPKCLIKSYKNVLNYLYKENTELNIFGMIAEDLEHSKQIFRRK